MVDAYRVILNVVKDLASVPAVARFFALRAQNDMGVSE